MKRIFLILISLTAMIALQVTSCTKTNQVDSGPAVAAPLKFSVPVAKAWFEQHRINFRQTAGRAANSKFDPASIVPDWDNAVKTEDDNYYVVDCPIKPGYHFGFTVANKGSDSSNDKINGITRVLVLQDKKTGEIKSALMHVYYNDGELSSRISYGNIPAEFSGNVFYTDQQCTFINGWIYWNGKVVAKSSGAVSAQNKAVAPSDGCETVIVNWYAQTCYYYADGGSDCTDWEWLFSTYETYCTGGGSGGYDDSEVDCTALLSSLEGTEVSEFEGSYFQEQNPTTRTKNYSWVFYRQSLGLWWFTSYEKGVHEKVNNEWRWKSLEHLSISKGGTTIGGVVECIINTATPTVGVYNAAMELNYDIKASAICKGSPLSSIKNYSTGHVFNIND